MKTTRRILAALALLVFAAVASAESIKLTLNQVYALANLRDGALLQLDAGITHVITTQGKEEGAEPEKQVVHTAYDFSAATRLAIYRNRRALADVLDDFEKSRAATVKKIWGERTPDEEKDTSEKARFLEEMAKLAAEEVKVEITRLKPEDLLRGGNPIPNDVLLLLRPILTEK